MLSYFFFWRWQTLSALRFFFLKLFFSVWFFSPCIFVCFLLSKLSLCGLLQLFHIFHVFLVSIFLLKVHRNVLSFLSNSAIYFRFTYRFKILALTLLVISNAIPISIFLSSYCVCF